MKKQPRWEWWSEVIAFVSIFFLASILFMAILIAHGRAQAEASYPVAIVEVNADSYLSVRKTPAGDLTPIRLLPYEEIVLLDVVEDWALVIRAQDYGKTDMNGTPLGWVSMDYLIIYSTKERMPTAATVSTQATTEYLLPFEFTTNGGKKQ